MVIRTQPNAYAHQPNAQLNDSSWNLRPAPYRQYSTSHALTYCTPPSEARAAADRPTLREI
eukprot:10542048-Lingulodinium_polyedra.AAC.1